MATYSNSAREVEMPNGDVVVLHSAPTGGANTTSNIKKFKYDDNGHVTESEAANATDLNLNSYSTPTTGSTAIGTSDAVQTAIGKLDHQSQIDQSNILYGTNMGVKNLLACLLRVATIGSSNSTIKCALQGDGSIVLNGSTTSSVAIFVITESGRWAASNLNGVDEFFENISYKIALFDGGNASGSGVYLDIYHSGWADRATCGVGGNITFVNPYILRLCVPENKTLNNVIVKPMVCTLDAWNQSSDYQPPALPNYDLTYLQAEDRASLAEVVDSGAKNVLKISGIDTSNANGVTYTLNSDGSITVNGTPSGTADSYITMSSPTNYVTWCDGKHYLSGCPKGGNLDTKYALYFIQGGYRPTDEGDGVLLTPTTASSLNLVINVRNGFTANNLVFKPMICTKAAFGVSNKFVPYRPNYDFVCEGRIPPRTNGTIMSGNLNDFPTSYYLCSGAVANLPEYTGYAIVKTIVIDSNAALQEAFMLVSNKTYTRTKWNGTWNSWVQSTNVSS